MSTATLPGHCKELPVPVRVQLTLSECDRLTLSFRVFQLNYASVISRGRVIALLTMWDTAVFISIFRFSKAAAHMLSGGFRSSVSNECFFFVQFETELQFWMCVVKFLWTLITISKKAS